MRHATLLLTLSASLHLSAQDFPFPTSDATWVQYFEEMMPPPPAFTFYWVSTANFCMIGADTLIAGTNYTRLDQCNAGYVGGIRSVDESVYFYPADSTQEYLLYDFGAAVGDTIYGVYVNEVLATGSSGWMGTRLVDVAVTASAPSSVHGGRIAVQVQAIDDLIGLDSEWLEGIGSIHGLFTFNPLNVSMYWYGLHCMSHNGNTYWSGGYSDMPGTCAPQSVGLDDRTMAGTNATLFPNPTTGIVYLTGSDTRNGTLVRDAMGRSVDFTAIRISNGGVQLDLGGLPSGLYIVSNMEGQIVGRVMRE
jgi:hypothetical protein